MGNVPFWYSSHGKQTNLVILARKMNQNGSFCVHETPKWFVSHRSPMGEEPFWLKDLSLYLAASNILRVPGTGRGFFGYFFLFTTENTSSRLVYLILIFVIT